MKLQLEIPPDTAELRRTRRIIDGWASAHRLPSDSLNLVATELLANAMAVCPAEQRILLVLDLHGEEVAVTVTDCGPDGFDLDPDSVIDPEATRGRGLQIVRHLCNRLSVERIGDRTVVTAYQYRQMLEPWRQAGPARSAEVSNGSGNGNGNGRHAGTR